MESTQVRRRRGSSRKGITMLTGTCVRSGRSGGTVPVRIGDDPAASSRRGVPPRSARRGRVGWSAGVVAMRWHSTSGMWTTVSAASVARQRALVLERRRARSATKLGQRSATAAPMARGRPM